MNSLQIKGLIFSSVLSGVTYWSLLFGWYSLTATISGHFPFDSIFILAPILVAATGLGLLVCAPVYLLLYRYRLNGEKLILLFGTLIAIVFVNLLINQWTNWYEGVFIPALSGFVGAMVFTRKFNKATKNK